MNTTNPDKSKTAPKSLFEKISAKITKAVGSAGAFITALGVVVLWLVTGPIFDYSETWQLLINTTTTIVTFLMVFIIQQSANKDTVAIHLKLNELIACNEKASNKLVDIEDLTDRELEVLKSFYIKLSQTAREDNDMYTTHSLDEAEKNHMEKARLKKKRVTAHENKA